MHRILVVDDDLHTRLAISAWLKRCGFRVAIADGGPTGLAALEDAALGVGATRRLRKPFRPATLLSVIDECRSEVEPHRRHAAILAAVATAPSEQKDGVAPPDFSRQKLAAG